MKLFLAPFLSFLICGLGQFYNGQIKKALIYMLSSFFFLIVFVISILILYQSFMNSIYEVLNKKVLFIGIILFTFSGFLLCLISLLSIVDAYIVAKKTLEKK